MRSQLVPLLQQSGLQAGGLSNNALCCVAEGLQGPLRSVLAAAACRGLSAAAAAGDAAAQESVAEAVSTADVSSPAATAAAAEAAEPATSSSSSSAAAAAAGHEASTSSSGSGSSGKSNGRARGSNGSTFVKVTAHQQMLQPMGLWFDVQTLRKVKGSHEQRMRELQRAVTLLREAPSGSMAAAVLNPYQLQTVVTPAISYEDGLHPLEYSEDWVQKQLEKRQPRQQRKQQKQQQEAAESKDGSSSSSSSGAAAAEGSSESKGAADAVQKQQEAAESNNSSSGSEEAVDAASKQQKGASRKAKQQEWLERQRDLQQQQQQRRAQALANAEKQVAELDSERNSPVWKVQLSPYDLVRENKSELMVNLNAQMDHAVAADAPEFIRAIHLFDMLLSQGIQAALDQQQQQQQQQQEEGSEAGAAGDQALRLPQQYRPDQHAFVTYCRAVSRVAQRHIDRLRELRQPLGGSNLQRRERNYAWMSEEERRAQSMVVKAHAKCLAQGIDRVSQLWDPSKDSQYHSAKWAVQLHLAKMLAFRAAGRHTEVLEYWEDLRNRLAPDVKRQYWKLDFCAAACALSYGNLEAADRYALVFSDKVNGVAFKKEDYQRAIGPLVVQLVANMAKGQMWDQAVYWLQQLLNHDPLLQVEDASFLIVQQEAAKNGRMDLARVMMSAMDDTRKIQGYEPYVYSEYQCLDLMHSAAKANDVPFIDAMWQRLQQDLQRDRRTNDKSQYPQRINSDSKIVQEISGGAAAPRDDDTAAEASSGSSSDRKQPSAHAHAEAVKAYVIAEAYGKAFEVMHAMEQLYPGDEYCSVFSGTRFFPESLNCEAKIGAAFEQLQLRKKNDQPITTTMMNVLTRSLALTSDTTTVGKVFNAYEPTYNLQPDVDTYNAVLESCQSNAKVAAVNGMLALMSSRGVAPNTVSWNLLLSTSLATGDGKQVAEALNRMHAAKIDPDVRLLTKALDLSRNNGDTGLQTVVRQIAQKILPPNHVLNRRLNAARVGAQGARGQPGNVGADRWQPAYGDSSSSSSSSSSSRGSSGGGSGSSRGGGYSGDSSGRSSSALRDSWRPGGQEDEVEQDEGGWAAKLRARY